MSLADLRERLAELRRRRAGAPKSLKIIVARQTKCPISKIYIGDRHIDLPSEEEVKEFLRKDKTNELEYAPPFDCEDFSLRLHYMAKMYGFHEKKSNWAFGNTWSQGHGFNLVCVKPNARVIFIEPQSDRYTVPHSKLRFILF